MKNYIPPHLYEESRYAYVTKLKINPPGLEMPPYDDAAFSKTQIGRRRDQLNSLFTVYGDAPMHPSLRGYWGRMGLKKELFDSAGKAGFDAKDAYSVFTPLDLDPEKKYALLYISHGGGQPIEWAENYGFNTLAAAEKYITVYAQNGGRSNNGVMEQFPRILEALREKGYPIDWERVYAVGFSSGCEATTRLSVVHTGVIAAIAVMPGGIPFTKIPFFRDPASYAGTGGQRMPGIFLGGTWDRGNMPAPWIADYHGSDLPVGRVENAIENINLWKREIAQTPNGDLLTHELVLRRLKSGEDPVLREFGMEFDRSYCFRAQGVTWLGGDYDGADGAPVMRMLRAENVPHMVWESNANLCWDYLKHFRREAGTGRSLYDPIVCWGER